MIIEFREDDGGIIRQIQIPKENEAALFTNMADPVEWLVNLLTNKARKVTDKIVERSGEGSRFTSPEKKVQIVADLYKKDDELMKPVKEAANYGQGKR